MNSDRKPPPSPLKQMAGLTPGTAFPTRSTMACTGWTLGRRAPVAIVLSGGAGGDFDADTIAARLKGRVGAETVVTIARDGGALDATQRANRVYKATIAAYEPPPLDPGRLEAIDAFIAKRTAEGGADISR